MDLKVLMSKHNFHLLPLKTSVRNSLEVQWLGLGAFTAVAWGSIPGQGTKTLQAAQCGQKNKNHKCHYFK